MSSGILISRPMRDADSLTRSAFAVPADACDAHVHVFGPAERYPRVDKPHYTLPDGDLAQLERATALQPFIDRYNWHRPHSALNHQPPISRIASVNNLLRLNT